MNSGMISTRYAKALLACAVADKAEKVLFDAMSAIADNFVRCEALTPALHNPTLTTPQKKRLILAAANDLHHDLLERFVDLVLQNKREEMLQRIALDYCDLYQHDSKICIGTVTTAKPLDDAGRQRISAFLEQWSGRPVELRTHIDPDLLGGFILNADNQRLDASIAGQLRRIRKDLAR